MVGGRRTSVKGFTSSYDRQNLIFDYINGRESLMLGARALAIRGMHSQGNWEWISLPESRFMQVAKLIQHGWFLMKGSIDINFLSPETTHAAYFIYKLEKSENFRGRSILVQLGFEGRETKDCCFLDLHSGVRRNGWMEIKIGEFFKGHESDSELFYHLEVVDLYDPLRGIIVEGIEIRPKIHRRYVGF